MTNFLSPPDYAKTRCGPGIFCVRRPLSSILTQFLAACCFLILVTAGHAVDGPVFDASTGLLYHSNLSNADHADDVEADGFWNAEFGSTWSQGLGRDWRAALRLFTGGEVPFEYDAFAMARIGAETHATYKFGLGRQAPKFSLGFKAERDFFEETARSRWLLTPTLRYQQPLSETWALDAFYRFDRFSANSPLFDGNGHEGGVTLRWAPSDRWSYAAGYRARRGDIVSYATPPRPELLSVAEVIVPGTRTFDRTLTAYRLEAITHTAMAGVAFAVTPDLSLELAYQYQYTMRNSINYDNHLVAISAKAAF